MPKINESINQSIKQMYSVGVGRQGRRKPPATGLGDRVPPGTTEAQPFPKSLTLETALSQDPEIRDEKL